MQPILRTRARDPRTDSNRSRLLDSPAFWSAAATTAALRIVFAWVYLARLAHRAVPVAPFAFESGNIARALATGHGFASPLPVASGPTAWVAPVYPALLAGLFRIFGVASFSALIAAVSLNIVFATLVCLPLFAATRALARHASGANTAEFAGLAACWLWAIYPNAILLTYQSMWDGCLSALLGITVLWAALRLDTDGRPRRPWVLYGVLWAVLLLTNPVFLAALPVLFAWALWRKPSHLARAALAVLVIVLCVLPWTIRNRAALHAWVPIRSDLGLSLWLGNNAGTTVPWRGQQHPLDDLSERALFVRQGEVPYMRAKFRAALAYIAEHPAQTATRAWLRFRAFWSGGTPHPLHAFLHGNWQVRYVLFADLLLGLGALAGIIALVRRKIAAAWAAAIFPILIPFAYYFTEAIPRYRLPIDPEIILLAACWLALRARPVRVGTAP